MCGLIFHWVMLCYLGVLGVAPLTICLGFTRFSTLMPFRQRGESYHVLQYVYRPSQYSYRLGSHRQSIYQVETLVASKSKWVLLIFPLNCHFKNSYELKLFLQDRTQMASGTIKSLLDLKVMPEDTSHHQTIHQAMQLMYEGFEARCNLDRQRKSVAQDGGKDDRKGGKGR